MLKPLAANKSSMQTESIESLAVRIFFSILYHFTNYILPILALANYWQD